MVLITWIILLLAIAGHALLLMRLMDYIYTLGLKQILWNVIELSLMALVVAGPVIMMRSVGRGHASVLRAGSWDAVHPLWMLYIAVCAAAVPIGLIVVVGRRFIRVKCRLSNHTTMHDALVALGRAPAVPGWREKFGQIPGNQIYSFDLTQLQLRVDTLPPALDGISILHLSDLHFNSTPSREFFEWSIALCQQQKPDLVALTGDIADHRGVLDWLPSTLGQLSAAPLGCYFTLGNHDTDPSPDEVRRAVEQLGWTCIGGKSLVLAHRDRTIKISGTDRPWQGKSPEITANSPADLHIFLSHSPHQVGWARRNNVTLMLGGHLHGGQIQLPLVGPIRGGRLASGLFELPPTILHVSRGLGEMFPLRLRCRPEATVLVLRTPMLPENV